MDKKVYCPVCIPSTAMTPGNGHLKLLVLRETCSYDLTCLGSLKRNLSGDAFSVFLPHQLTRPWVVRGALGSFIATFLPPALWGEEVGTEVFVWHLMPVALAMLVASVGVRLWSNRIGSSTSEFLLSCCGVGLLLISHQPC